MGEPRPDPRGHVVAIHVFPGSRSRSTPRPVERVQALAERGLEGDRHAARSGHRRQVLVAEQEALDHFALVPGQIREQLTVRGLDLDALAAGTRVRIGGACFTVGAPCEPCERMNEIRPGLLEAIDGRRGRFFAVAESGPIAVGDAIVVEPA